MEMNTLMQYIMAWHSCLQTKYGCLLYFHAKSPFFMLPPPWVCYAPAEAACTREKKIHRGSGRIRPQNAKKSPQKA